MANKFNTILPGFMLIAMNLTFIYRMKGLLIQHRTLPLNPERQGFYFCTGKPTVGRTL